MARNKGDVKLERETEHMTPEEHAEMVAAQMMLRGNSAQIGGAMLKLRGQLMRSNALLKPERIRKALEEINMLSKQGLDELKKISA